MAVYFEELDIKSFRGLKNVKVSGLRNVNILVGDNNSGKTSFMEALCLFRNPSDFYNVLKVARMRDVSSLFSPGVYDSFISIFPKNEMRIKIYATGEAGESYLEISGEEQKELSNVEMMSPYTHVKYNKHDKSDLMEEVLTFYGEMNGRDKHNSFHENINFNAFMRTSDIYFRRPKSQDSINTVYLSPLSHIQGNTFNRIIKNSGYKDICLRLLQLFDPNIVDLLFLKNENTMRAVECLEHKELGIMPLSTYGDGVKKVLSLANGMASASNGILLIDEIETSINYKYYSEVFSFIIMAAQQFNVQVFISTHNSEVIDAILDTQMYEKDGKYDPIGVITFRKNFETGIVRTRILSGREVYEDRKNFGLEVRL